MQYMRGDDLMVQQGEAREKQEAHGRQLYPVYEI